MNHRIALRLRIGISLLLFAALNTATPYCANAINWILHFMGLRYGSHIILD